MNQIEGLRKLATIIQTEYRHKYYIENCELYEKYKTLSTGKGWEGFLHRLTSRVSLQDFQEIIDVTIDICKSVVKNLTHVFYRVTRSIGIKIEYKVEDETKKNDFEGALKTFGKWGFEGYCDKRFTDFCKIDPNGFLVIDFKGTDGTVLAIPYPVEFYSPDIIDYDYNLNLLLYLVVKQDLLKKVDEGSEMASDFTIYTQEGAVKFIARPDVEAAPMFDYTKDIARTPQSDGYRSGDLVAVKETTTIDEKGQEQTEYDIYELSIPLPYNKSGEGWVPAACIGYLPDEHHKGETFLNFFDNAVPLFEKIIKANSESDISMAKHCFGQKIQFVRPCPNGCESNNTGVFCVDNSVCPVCQGSGYMDTHRTGMDVITFPLTDANVENLNLDNVIKYVTVPLETIKYQWDHIEQLIEMAKRVMYNSEMFSRETIAQTATAKLIEMQNMMDTVSIYGVHFASMKKWILETIAAITEIKITVNVIINKGLGMLDIPQLFEMLQLANLAGANTSIIEAIQDALAYAFLGNTPAYQNYLNRKKLLPFQNKSKEQIMLILSNLPVDNYYRMMFEYGEEVLKVLENTVTDWNQLTMEAQKRYIDAELEKIKVELTPIENPAAPIVRELNSPVV